MYDPGCDDDDDDEEEEALISCPMDHKDYFYTVLMLPFGTDP